MLLVDEVAKEEDDTQMIETTDIDAPKNPIGGMVHQHTYDLLMGAIMRRKSMETGRNLPDEQRIIDEIGMIDQNR